MAMMNCPRCGRVYDSAKMGAICADCMLQENKDLKEVTDYLRKFPLASVIEVNENTSVSVGQIMRFVRSGALRMTAPPPEFKCRLCGAGIKKGTLCTGCRGKVEELNRNTGKKP
ncbi:MAG: hypothetical protein ACLFP1_05415 [Candidatus Goldiibacteriota bacterium]